jgi:oxygen-independent coproporphyrinogen-3 oxidase
VEDGDEKDTRDNELYFFTVDHLARLGYVHYEVSNFCKSRFQSRHNLKYWKNESYIGLGLSASGYEGGIDYKNARSFKGYFKKLDAGQLPLVETRRRVGDFRRIVMGLRLLDGLPRRYFEKYPEQLDFLLSNGLLVRRGHCGDKIAVNPRKLLLLNEILGYFV